jgi:hypothetical protein
MAGKVSRRETPRTLGAVVGGTFLPWSAHAINELGEPLILPDPERLYTPQRPVTAITLGAGARGTVYGNFAVTYPDQLRIVGVAEPIPARQERHAKTHSIPAENRFVTWEHVFKRPKFADAVIISTPDDLHYGPCIRVLRYAPYFVKLRDLIQGGAIGRVVSLQHFEPIEHVHMAHSFVRGNWHNSRATSPIILAKSCHDLDILRWMVGNDSRAIQAFGALSWFKPENAPPGSTACCTDGCAAESTCPYSALRIYHRGRQRIHVLDLPATDADQGEAILDRLRTTN